MVKIIEDKTAISKIQVCPQCGSSWELENGEEKLNVCPCCFNHLHEDNTHSKLSNKDRIIQDIMENFDFGKVHKVMEFLDWTWWFNGVPSVDDLKDQAHSLLDEAWEKQQCVATGGFRVAYERPNHDGESPYLCLSFELDSWGSWIENDELNCN